MCAAKVDDYDVVGHIGCGSFGVCKKIRRKADNRVLVWKELHYGVMSELEKQMLVSEVNLLRELRHPHIVRYYGHILDRSTATLYIIMEHCEGGDLGALVSQCRQERRHLEEEFIWKVAWQLAQALRECHGRKKDRRAILHRDLKPANVFLDAERNVKLGDFGVARVLSNESMLAKTFVGTPSYMSPEQIRKRGYNEKSDVWSLGCLVYELCSLVPPFVALTQAQLAAKIEEGKVWRIPSIYSNDLQSLTSSMLTVENELRPSIDMLLHHPQLMLLHCRERRPRFPSDGNEVGEHSGDNTRPSQKQNRKSTKCFDVELKEKLFAEREKALNDREDDLNRREKWITIQEELLQEKMTRMSEYFKLFEQLGVGGEDQPPEGRGTTATKLCSVKKGSIRSLATHQRRSKKWTRSKRVRFVNEDTDGSVREPDTSVDDSKVKQYYEEGKKCGGKENCYVQPLEASFNTRMGTIGSRLKAAQRRALHLRVAEMESRMQSIIL